MSQDFSLFFETAYSLKHNKCFGGEKNKKLRYPFLDILPFAIP